MLVSITSDAAAEHYETWGLYGATKAALEHLTLTFGAENPQLTAYAVDPGDMRTAMHQAAFPGEDISDRPLPEQVVPRLLGLLDAPPPVGSLPRGGPAGRERRSRCEPGGSHAMTTLSEHPTTTFSVPGSTFAPAPAEQRGLARDGVRLLVARPDEITHARFRDLPGHLGAGDVVVVNNSATVAGQADARSPRLGPVVLHVATPLDDGSWVLEVRTAPDAVRSVLDARAGDRLELGPPRGGPAGALPQGRVVAERGRQPALAGRGGG